MNSSLLLAEAVELYDCLVEKMSSSAATDADASNAVSTLDRCCQLHRLCHILLQVHNTIDPILSNSQQEAIQSTLDQVRRTLQSDDADYDDCLHVNWDRATLRMEWWEETNLMCGWNKNQLQLEEDMLLAMASTPIPNEGV
jgi:hypothetical protein